MSTFLKISLVFICALVTTKYGFGQEPSYRIVFPKVYTGRIYAVGNEEFDKVTRERRRILIKELNFWGKRHYRYVVGTGGSDVLVRLDEGSFEYDWWRTDSSQRFAVSGFAQKLVRMNEFGFKVIDHFMDFPICEKLFEDEPYLGESCQYTHTFIFEKELGSKQNPKQIVTDSVPAWGAKPSEEMAGGIDTQLAEGFYPALAISNFEILLEQIPDKEDILDDRPDVKVVRSAWSRGDMKRKVSAAAKQGYRITETTKGMAVMYRNSRTSGIPVDYEWLEADKKDLEKQIKKFSSRGVRYSDSYPDWNAGTTVLIFETDPKRARKSSDIQLIAVEQSAKEDSENKTVTQALTPAGEQAMRKINELAKNGYIPRTLFGRNRSLYILMEKLP